MKSPPIAVHVSSAILSIGICSLLCASAAGQARFVLCDKGFGSFESAFDSGVSVSVGPVKKAGFAARACQAKLTWENQTLPVSPEASQADIDVMGADMGLGSLVVAFQIKKQEDDPLMNYEIYSLSKPPRLLRTITGGDFFSAADTRLDGSGIEIWTTDAAAIDGFDKLPLRLFDFAPTVVLRFEQRRLVDVSSEFQSHFDSQIAGLRSQLTAQQLDDFKKSDGIVASPIPSSKEELGDLLATKIKILEIVWCYLYSGRDQDAWNALAAMWPPADADRIRAALLKARSLGLRSQVDDVSHKTPSLVKMKHAFIFERLRSEAQDSARPQSQSELRAFQVDSFPKTILMRREVRDRLVHASSNEEENIEMVIDAAGKVRSAKVLGTPDEALVKDASGWKFIPAYQDGHPVACDWIQSVKFFY